MLEIIYSFSCKMGVELASLEIYEDKLIIKNNSINEVIDYYQIISLSYDEDNNNEFQIFMENKLVSLNIFENKDKPFLEAFDFINNTSVNYKNDLTQNNSSDKFLNVKTKIEEDTNVLDLLSKQTNYKKEIDFGTNFEIIGYGNCIVYDEYISIENSYFTQEIPYYFIKNVILNENNNIRRSVTEKLILELLLSNNQKIILYFKESDSSKRFQLYNLILPKIENARPIYYESSKKENKSFDEDSKIKQNSSHKNNFQKTYFKDINKNVNHKNNLFDRLFNQLNNYKKKKRNIIILLILGLIVVGALTFLPGNKAPVGEDNQIFYDGIKKISDIENKSDAKLDIVREKTNPNSLELKGYSSERLNTTNYEIFWLNDLKNKVSNESYIEYIDIQIHRLNSENMVINDMYLKLNNLNYSNGTSNYSESTKSFSDGKVIINYTADISKYKRDAESFLSVHTDMRDKFNELGIDEDFLYDQIEEVNMHNHF